MKNLIGVLTFFILLFVGSGAALATTDVEPNDSRAEAVKMTFDANNQFYIEGDISGYWDEDYYSLELPADGSFSIEGLEYLSHSFDIEIQTATGEELEYYSTKLGSTDVYEHVSETGLKKGLYFIKISRDQTSDNMDYDFKVTFNENPYFEKESNESRSEATPITLNQEYTGWRLNYDTDYYYFETSKNGELKLSFPNSLKNRYIVELLDINGNDISWFYTNLNSTIDDKLFHIGIPKGSYFLKISNYDYESKEKYTFELNFKENALIELEPNGERSKATEVKLNQRYTGIFDDNYDKDYYRVVIDRKGTYNFQISHSEKAQYYMTLMDNTGNQLKYAYTNLEGKSMATLYSYDLAPGTYFIETEHYDGQMLKLPYEMAVTQDVKPPALTVTSKVTSRTTSVEVKTAPSTKVTVKNGSTAIGSATSDGQGVAKISIPKQPVNAVLTFHVNDSLGTSHQAQKVTVLNGDYVDLTSSHWAYKQVMYLADAGIIGGYPDGTFQPNRNTTRAEAARMLATALDLNVVDTTSIFKDVPTSHWANDYIVAAAKAGIFKGNPDGTFNPNGQLTRAEMAILLSTAYDLNAKSPAHFSDVKASHWANEAIASMYENNLTVGYPDGTYRPSNSTTRAEFSMFLAKALNPDFR